MQRQSVETILVGKITRHGQFTDKRTLEVEEISEGVGRDLLTFCQERDENRVISSVCKLMAIPMGGVRRF